MSNKRSKNKQVVYSSNKPGRGVKFSVYTNGEIVIEGVGSQYGLNIPAQLKQWLNLPERNDSFNWKLKADLEIIYEDKKHFLKDISVTILFKSKKWFISPSNVLIEGKNLRSILSERSELICSLILPRKYWSKKYLQSINIFNSFNYSEKSNFKTIAIGGKATGFYEVIQDNKKQFFIKLETSMSESGAIQFPAELAQVFKNWTSNKELFLCLFEDGQKQIVEASFVKDKSRPERIRKVLNFSYNGERKNVSVICHSSNLELSSKMKQDVELKQILVKFGFQLKSLKSNVFPLGSHKNKRFEEKVRLLFTNAFNKTDAIVRDEVALSPNYLKSLPIESQYTFDLLVFYKNKQLPTPSKLLLLIEIKSSLGKSKTKVINDSIANLKHYQTHLGEENVLPIFVMNAVFNKRKKEIIDMYSIKNGILILDNDKLCLFRDQPELLIETILSFKQKISLLQNNPLVTYHPQTKEIVSIEKLRNEALTLLINKSKGELVDRKTLNSYCMLMNIRKADFNRLYHYYESAVNENHSMTSSLTPPIYKNKSTIIYKAIHNHLCENGSVSMIQKIPQQCFNRSNSELRLHSQQIYDFLPKEMHVVGLKEYNHQGKTYEKIIQKELESKKYEVIPNILFYFAFRLIEIDLFALREKELLLTSCKNMSSFVDFPQTTVAIKRAVKLLSYRKQLLNADKGLVCVRVNKQFRDKFKKKFNNKVFAKDIEVKITD